MKVATSNESLIVLALDNKIVNEQFIFNHICANLCKSALSYVSVTFKSELIICFQSRQLVIFLSSSSQYLEYFFKVRTQYFLHYVQFGTQNISDFHYIRVGIQNFCQTWYLEICQTQHLHFFYQTWYQKMLYLELFSNLALRIFF